MIPPTKRTPSLSLRQSIGILTVGFAFLWLFATLAASINVMLEMFREYSKHQFHSTAYIIGGFAGIFITLLIGVGILLLGIWLLRDRKGMYISFLKN